MLDEYLDSFDEEKRKILRIGFRDGFKIDFEGEDCELDCVNSKAAQELPQTIGEKIKLELSKGRLAGPFSEKPFDYFKCSPLSIHEKQKKGHYRLSHNLRYPYDQPSVNHNITKANKTVHYSTVTEAIEMIMIFGKGRFLAKSDISEAFRLLPLHPDIYHLIGFKWEGLYYYDLQLCLPIGCGS